MVDNQRDRSDQAAVRLRGFGLALFVLEYLEGVCTVCQVARVVRAVYCHALHDLQAANVSVVCNGRNRGDRSAGLSCYYRHLMRGLVKRYLIVASGLLLYVVHARFQPFNGLARAYAVLDLQCDRADQLAVCLLGFGLALFVFEYLEGVRTVCQIARVVRAVYRHALHDLQAADVSVVCELSRRNFVLVVFRYFYSDLVANRISQHDALIGHLCTDRLNDLVEANR